MPEPHRSKSKSQQRLFGMIHSLNKGTLDLSKAPADLKAKLQKMAKSIKNKTVKQFASTKHKGLPNRKRKKKRKAVNKDLQELKSIILQEVMQHLEEGVDDPGILKMVFMAGGPGSGKSYKAAEVFGIQKMKSDRGSFESSFSATGLKVVNSDTMFVQLLKKHGISPKEVGSLWKELQKGISSQDYDKALKVFGPSDMKGKGGLRGDAKGLVNRMKQQFMNRRLGMIVDGTGHNYEKIKKQKEAAEAAGYDTYMVFVNTSLEVAIERDKNRDRTVGEKIVTNLWQECQNNLGRFQGLFGANNISIIDNTIYGPPAKEVMKATRRFVSMPVKNRVGKQWIELQRKIKASGELPGFEKR